MQISCSELESRRSGKGHFAAAPAPGEGRHSGDATDQSSAHV